MRRSRAQFKPNLGPTATAQSATEESKPVSKSEVISQAPRLAASSIESAAALEIAPSVSNNASNATIVASFNQPMAPPVIHVETVSTEKKDHVFRSPLPKRADPGQLLSPRARLLSTSAAHDGGAVISPRSRYLSTCSEMFGHGKKERKKFTGDEQLDPKTMRMIDLITWNPKNEKKLDRTKLDNCETRSEMEREDERPAAPQLKLDANGKLIVDETSLLLDERATHSVWQVVEEDRAVRKVNSSSFRRWRKGTPWSEKETEFFYEILRSTGPDFGLMHDFFPRRSRNELKSKFNREEKYNWERLTSVLSKPSALSDTLYARAETMTNELIREESEKMEAKMPKKKRNGEKIPQVEEDEWDEDTADLVKEAEDTINELIEVDRRKEELARLKKEERIKKRKLSKEATAIIDQTVKGIKRKNNGNNVIEKEEKGEEKTGCTKKRKKKMNETDSESTKKRVITGYPESDDSREDVVV